ncbi:hypothetical protein CLOM_g5914 [Closterium sp. NIES-68]|nr:hypothetical protein CLOM_g5914 [Closterium sp. NIES-68]GJP63249.1 hypothetical protein CLOP_g20309 [Closterium sp. NIES-67]
MTSLKLLVFHVLCSLAFLGLATSSSSLEDRDDLTLAILKPDLMGNGVWSGLANDIRAAGFQVVHEKMLFFDESLAEKFYAEHKGKKFYQGLIDFMLSAPVTAMVLQHENAPSAFRELIGPTNPKTARAAHPESLRAKYGTDVLQNAVHGSASVADAHREISLFFPDWKPPPSLKMLMSLEDASEL